MSLQFARSHQLIFFRFTCTYQPCILSLVPLSRARTCPQFIGGMSTVCQLTVRSALTTLSIPARDNLVTQRSLLSVLRVRCMRWHSRLCCIRLQLVPRNSPETHSDISKITYFWRFTTTIEDGTGDKSAKLNRLVERISIGSLLRHFPSTSPRTRVIYQSNYHKTTLDRNASFFHSPLEWFYK